MTTLNNSNQVKGRLQLSCTYVVAGPCPFTQPTPYKDIINDTFKEHERLLNLAKQQDRTLKKKREFIKQRKLNPLATVVSLCEAVGIDSTKTFYNWYKTDPYFRVAYETIGDLWSDFVMDALMISIARGDARSIRYYLDRYHPSYMKQKEIDEQLARYLAEHKNEDDFIKYFRIG